MNKLDISDIRTDAKGRRVNHRDARTMARRGLCETCASGHWEHGHLTGEPSFVHADGTREFYYECDCQDSAAKAGEDK